MVDILDCMKKKCRALLSGTVETVWLAIESRVASTGGGASPSLGWACERPTFGPRRRRVTRAPSRELEGVASSINRNEGMGVYVDEGIMFIGWKFKAAKRESRLGRRSLVEELLEALLTGSIFWPFTGSGVPFSSKSVKTTKGFLRGDMDSQLSIKNR
ncbi:hypothetical protein U1Q18_052536 [Sarracenia purpurea var. burkii]